MAITGADSRPAAPTTCHAGQAGTGQLFGSHQCYLLQGQQRTLLWN